MFGLAGLSLFWWESQTGDDVQEKQDASDLQEIKLIFSAEAIEPSEVLADQRSIHH